ncbi:FkbM family methyltransferase [Marivita hallyeonensis]|uniref:Methyltransferase, FkbM family n=1 Tax=Marivita hallyeonensis TaxID=996342 RepID=A0A1M5W434_9RHOB|nr:FkbM family methyltransferase [Marivita hallyeonensis]SHH82208.1 methyltransferase, FkbM family [Marivita hallyeonensis]
MAQANRNTPLRRAKYGLMQHLPGELGLKYRRKLRKLYAPAAEAAFWEALAGAAGKVCVDLGANLGQHTRTMAAHAAKVYAFEPDPWTAAQLREALADLDNVEVVEAAAGTEDGTFPLYRTASFDADPVEQSQSSSLMAQKRNVDTSSAIDVAVVDFPAFLERLETDIAVIKMDIEGAEVPLLEVLFDHPVMRRIGHLFVETHESRIPDLLERTDALRARAAEMVQPVVNMDWK